jgi:hypothetical protein
LARDNYSLRRSATATATATATQGQREESEHAAEETCERNNGRRRQGLL